MESFDALVEDAQTAPTSGWDFSWLNGRATEERPTWHYMDLVRARLRDVTSVLDLQVGGGEWLSLLRPSNLLVVATEGWQPNVALADQRLRRLGIHVVAAADEEPLPLADRRFDLVVARHPTHTQWSEVARVLSPGGTFLSQQVGPQSVGELTEALLGPRPRASTRSPDLARRDAEASGLDVVDLRSERPLVSFRDIGAIVYFLRLVPWIVPGFSVEQYREQLMDVHHQIDREGAFLAHSARFLIEAQKPACH